MTKITGLEQKMFQNKPQGFKVTFDDGRNGNMEEKQSDKGLRIGDEVIVTEIPYTSKAGKVSTLYGVRLNQGQPQQSYTPAPQSSNVPQPPRPAIHVGAGKSKEELKADAAIRMAEIVIEGFFNDKVESANVEPKAREYTKLLWSEIEEIFSGK
jgi:hypothetical protein